MPRGNQLDEYRGKVRDGSVAVENLNNDGKKRKSNIKPTLENTSFFLLAPQKSIDCAFKTMSEGWATVSYEAMLNAFPDAVQGNAFASNFISEYKQMMGDLLVILGNAVITASDENSPCLADKDVLAVLEKIRAHDIYQKLFFSAMHGTLGIQRTAWKCDVFYQHGGCIKWMYNKNGITYGIELQGKDFHLFAESEKGLPDEATLKPQLLGWLHAGFDEKDFKQKKDGTMNGYYGTHKYVHAYIPDGTSIAALRGKITAIMAEIEK